jgi:hypothetical protein
MKINTIISFWKAADEELKNKDLVSNAIFGLIKVDWTCFATWIARWDDVKWWGCCTGLRRNMYMKYIFWLRDRLALKHNRSESIDPSEICSFASSFHLFYHIVPDLSNGERNGLWLAERCCQLRVSFHSSKRISLFWVVVSGEWL